VYCPTISAHGQQPDCEVSLGYVLYPSVWEPFAGIVVVLLEVSLGPLPVQANSGRQVTLSFEDARAYLRSLLTNQPVSQSIAPSLSLSS